MRALSSYLALLLAVMYWGFRVYFTYTNARGQDIGLKLADPTTEIILLFVTLILLIFVYRRNLIGALIYLMVYVAYFGPQAFSAIMTIVQTKDGSVDIYTYDGLIASAIGIIVALFAFLTVFTDKHRTAHPTDKKTDWFYKNKQYDRKIDKRADTNDYRTM